MEESLQTLRFAQRAKAVKTKVTESLLNQTPAQLLKQIEELTQQLETTQMLVRQLQRELAEKTAEEEARVNGKLAAVRANVGGGGGGGGGGEGGAGGGSTIVYTGDETIDALQEEVQLWKKKHRTLVGRAILHRVLKGQSVAAMEALKQESERQIHQLEESESLLRFRERENRELHARIEMLEHLLHEQQLTPQAGAALIGDGADLTKSLDTGGELTEETILTAEAELQAAMASKDPERLKKAIANASEAVARARAKNSQVLKKANIIKGGGDGSKPSAGPRTSIRVAPKAEVSEEEKKYMLFHQLATARKLALASRGFEVQNIYIDELFDEAQDVPQNEWHEFIRIQLPSPRGLDESGNALWEEEQPDKEAKGWKARALQTLKGKKLSSIIQQAQALMEKPEGVQEVEGAMDLPAESAPLHAGLDAHMDTLYLQDAPEFYGASAGGGGRQRYSMAVRQGMQERQGDKGDVEVS